MTSIVQTSPSICIPRTLNNVDWKIVKSVFEEIIGKGSVERVDIVKSRQPGDPFCKIFVHLRFWPNNDTSNNIRQRLLDGDPVKIVYDSPYFWKCSASRIPKPVWESTPPYVDFGHSHLPPLEYSSSHEPALHEPALHEPALHEPALHEPYPTHDQVQVSIDFVDSKPSLSIRPSRR